METTLDRSLLSDLYDRDYSLWLATTSQLLRNRQLDRIDLEHLAEELEDMGKSEKRAIESNLEILLMHLLKYQYQPEKQTNSWRYTIYEHRKRLKKAFKDSPSLRGYFEQVFDSCYTEARTMAALETGMNRDDFPEVCPFSIAETLDSDYWPENEV
ncbi:DUF29 domain-containing protein [Roseofilum sp. BLCC_M154]|uniref:DUF29 domain-containing protein n=1 Tax=Roseofilum acuticapitatum BLCC-M154 TaxID=3022444 RepID=A0ABT7AT77_9CYAN|nr:DUF29 domain-containing protein [Roseofilum acuticapitatum]MDJ1170112.1 DUF29 domain-containing protein [Roseofilum acuticapitatum BLCC-M154]